MARKIYCFLFTSCHISRVFSISGVEDAELLVGIRMVIGPVVFRRNQLYLQTNVNEIHDFMKVTNKKIDECEDDVEERLKRVKNLRITILYYRGQQKKLDALQKLFTIMSEIHTLHLCKSDHIFFPEFAPKPLSRFIEALKSIEAKPLNKIKSLKLKGFSDELTFHITENFGPLTTLHVVSIKPSYLLKVTDENTPNSPSKYIVGIEKLLIANNKEYVDETDDMEYGKCISANVATLRELYIEVDAESRFIYFTKTVILGAIQESLVVFYRVIEVNWRTKIRYFVITNGEHEGDYRMLIVQNNSDKVLAMGQKIDLPYNCFGSIVSSTNDIKKVWGKLEEKVKNLQHFEFSIFPKDFQSMPDIMVASSDFIQHFPRVSFRVGGDLIEISRFERDMRLWRKFKAIISSELNCNDLIDISTNIVVFKLYKMTKPVLMKYATQIVQAPAIVELTLANDEFQLLAVTLEIIREVGKMMTPGTEYKPLAQLEILNAHVRKEDKDILMTVIRREILRTVRSIQFTVKELTDAQEVKGWFDASGWHAEVEKNIVKATYDVQTEQLIEI